MTEQALAEALAFFSKRGVRIAQEQDRYLVHSPRKKPLEVTTGELAAFASLGGAGRGAGEDGG